MSISKGNDPTSDNSTAPTSRGLRRNLNGKVHRSKKSATKLLRDKEKLEPNLTSMNKRPSLLSRIHNSLFFFLSKRDLKIAPDEEDDVRNPTKEISFWTLPTILSICIGPFCWLLGHFGYQIQWALVLTLLIVMSLFELRKSVERKSWLVAKRQAAAKHFSQDDESSEWFNEILQNIWSFYEPILCRDLSEVLLSKLEAMKPSRVYSFEIQQFTMGSQAPFFNATSIKRSTINNTFSFNPTSERNPTDKDKKNENNYDFTKNKNLKVVVVTSQFGFHAPDYEVVIAAKTQVGTLPLAIKDFMIEGTMRIEFHIVPEFPHVRTAFVSFVEPKPLIAYDIHPLMAGNVMEIPVLADYLENKINEMIYGRVVYPAKVEINLMKENKLFSSVFNAVGHVAFITILDAEYPATYKNYVGNSDYYCKLLYGSNTEYYTYEIEESICKGDRHLIEFHTGNKTANNVNNSNNINRFSKCCDRHHFRPEIAAKNSLFYRQSHSAHRSHHATHFHRVLLAHQLRRKGESTPAEGRSHILGCGSGRGASTWWVG